MSVKVYIEGLRELQDALRELPDATARNVMKRTLIEAAQPLVARAASSAPVNTGKLKMSITAGTKLSRRQKRMAKRVDPSDVDVYVGAGPLAQAHLQEYGSDHNPAQPFLRPAWEATKNGILATIKRALGAQIEKAAARRARKLARAAG